MDVKTHYRVEKERFVVAADRARWEDGRIFDHSEELGSPSAY